MSGGAHSTPARASATAPQRVAWRRVSEPGAAPRQSHAIAATAMAPTPRVRPRYGTWVWAQKDPAKTATGSMATSPHATDHTARRNTSHHSRGMYGFHGS